MKKLILLLFCLFSIFYMAACFEYPAEPSTESGSSTNEPSHTPGLSAKESANPMPRVSPRPRPQPEATSTPIPYYIGIWEYIAVYENEDSEEPRYAYYSVLYSFEFKEDQTVELYSSFPNGDGLELFEGTYTAEETDHSYYFLKLELKQTYDISTYYDDEQESNIAEQKIIKTKIQIGPSGLENRAVIRIIDGDLIFDDQIYYYPYWCVRVTDEAYVIK